MSNQQIISYINMGIQFLNDKLHIPTQMLQKSLMLNIKTLPDILKTPLNFSTILLFIVFIIIGYANNLICNVIGILYPLIYGLDIFNGAPIDTNRSVKLNKYWMLFGIFHLIDTFFGFILYLIPGYFYLKIALIYAMIRADFELSNTLFNCIESFYVKSNVYPKVEILLSYINSRINSSQPSNKSIGVSAEQKSAQLIGNRIQTTNNNTLTQPDDNITTIQPSDNIESQPSDNIESQFVVNQSVTNNDAN